MAALSVRSIEAIKPKDRPFKVSIDRGLQLCIASDGRRTLLIRYTVKGSKDERQYSLPQDYGEGPSQIKLADAKAEAARIRALARELHDVRRDDRLPAAKNRAERMGENGGQPPIGMAAICQLPDGSGTAIDTGSASKMAASPQKGSPLAPRLSFPRSAMRSVDCAVSSPVASSSALRSTVSVTASLSKRI